MTQPNGAFPDYVVDSKILTWDQVAAGDFPRTAPEIPARTAFRQAVAQAATALRAQAPALTSRITKAVQIVLAGDIEPGEGGKYIVGSQSDAGLHYVIDGVCACKDAERPEIGGRCKHVLAAEIFTQAYTQTAQTLAARDVVTEGKAMEALTPAPKTVLPLLQTLELRGAVQTDAPYSLNVRVSKGGYTFQVTVRKSEQKELLDAMNGLPEWLESHGYSPAEAQRHAVRETAEAPTEAPSCRYHGTQAMSTSKFGGYKCDMKLSDGTYCNQPWPRKAKA